jgi:uncharacterized Zn finger protein
VNYPPDYPEYVTEAEKEERARKQVEKLRQKKPALAPVIIQGRTLAKTWWGNSWNRNLEIYADYTNRLARGRSYVKTGAVVDLQIETGLVTALVQGSRRKPYDVRIKIAPLPEAQLQAILKLCNRRIANLEQLIAGQFPPELAEIFTLRGKGLFPGSKEIAFDCSCPDWAYMCKHVTAVLYGIGARFDQDPTLFFKLRDIDFSLLLKKTVAEKVQNMLANAEKTGGKRVLAEADVPALFGLEEE